MYYMSRLPNLFWISWGVVRIAASQFTTSSRSSLTVKCQLAANWLMLYLQKFILFTHSSTFEVSIIISWEYKMFYL